MATGCQIETSIAAKDDLFRTITKYYDLQESMDQAIMDMTPTEIENDTQITDEDSPIVRLVNQIIANGVAQRASDIHFDPQETEFRVTLPCRWYVENRTSFTETYAKCYLGSY